MTTRRSISLDPRDVVIPTHGTREALHAAVTRLYQDAQRRVAADTDKVDTETGEVEPRTWRLIFSEDEDDRTLRQNRFYFGVVLAQISEQAQLGGTRYVSEAWHEHGKRQFLGFEVLKVAVAGRKRPQVYRRLRSTKDLSVKQMSEYLDQLIAYASTDLGVAFDFNEQEREAVRWKRRAAKKPAEALAA